MSVNTRWEMARAEGAVIEAVAIKKAPRANAAPKDREINVADEIIEGLWMGGVAAGKMAAQGMGDFTAIVNVAGESTAWEPKRGYGKTYINFQFSDGDLPDLNQLDALVEHVAQLFILGNDKAKVLIHCTMGINRSGLVTALVVRRLKGLSGMEALRLVREKRELHGQDFYSPGTKEKGHVAVFNSIFANYVEGLQ